MVRITQYGAVGNGITDCSCAIAKALVQERETFKMNGEQLYLDEDCYDLTIRSK